MKKLLLFIFWVLPFFIFSQDNPPIKWGKVNDFEKELKKVPFDSSAAAVILCDYGRIFTTFGDKVTFSRHTRIKILTDAGKKYANISIPYYHTNGAEKIVSHNAATINIVDGKVKETKIRKKDFFKVKVNENWSELRFTLPDIQPGSIIEYAYVTESENFMNLESWDFQNELPTLKSRFFASIDGGLRYKIMIQGQQLISKYAGKSSNIWELENLPAIEEASFCPNPFDYTENIRFQLTEVASMGGYQKIMGTWSMVAKDFYDLGGLKQYLKKNKDASKILAQIITPNDQPQEKVQKIYDYIVSNYSWNKRYRLLPDADYSDFKTNTSGSSAEINLFFINLLQSADLECYPALISTKQHGVIHKDLIFYSQFNHLIACVKLEGKDLLIDATSPFRPYILLDREDLNHDALVLNKKEPYWVEVKPTTKTKEVNLVKMSVPEPGIVNFTMEVNARGYDAELIRQKLFACGKNLKKLFQDHLIKEGLENNISNLESKKVDEMEESVYVAATVQNNTLCTVSGDFLYISPFVDKHPDSNPFNDKDRYLPVDLYHPFEETYILMLTIPEGYEVVEYPKISYVKLKDDKGFLKYSSNLKDDVLQIRSTFKINDPFFNSLDYPALSELFDRNIEKREEQIVLKAIK